MVRLAKNRLSQGLMLALAGYVLLSLLVPPIWFSAFMGACLLVFGAVVFLSYAPDAWGIMRSADERISGAHLAVIGVAAIGLGFMYSGAFRIAWASAGQPREWIGTWFSNFASATQAAGLVLLAVSPEVSKEGIRPPKWYIAAAILVGVAALAFVFGMQFARTDTGKAAMNPTLWQLSSNGYDCAQGLVKGNRGKGGRIYHSPNSHWYSQTVAEDCFKTEWDARNQGYRAPLEPAVTFRNANAG
jgi:hypothetical protein